MGGKPAHSARDLSNDDRFRPPAAALAAIRGCGLWRPGRRRRNLHTSGGGGGTFQEAGPGGGGMKNLRGWVIALVLALLIGVVAYFGQPRQDSPEHNSNSDAANGTSAARLFAQAMGHPTSQIEGTFSPPSPAGLMFVFTPTSPYTADDADQTANWVRQGGVLVYASEEGDSQLDRAFSVTRLSGFASSQTEFANPVLDGVSSVSGGDLAIPFLASSAQVPILRSGAGAYPLGYIEKVGSGTIVVLADP